MNLSLCIFLIGIIGFIINRTNLILILISIEILLLSITLFLLINSYNFEEGQTFSIYIIAIQGAESAIGLGILVTFYRLRGNLSITNLCIPLFFLFLYLVLFSPDYLEENLELKVRMQSLVHL